MRIFITSGYSYWGQLDPRTIFEPVDGAGQTAGGETAMVQTATQLAKRGHEVLLFHDIARPTRYRGVDYLPKDHALKIVTRLKGDVLISWEDPRPLGMNHTCDLVIYSMQTNSMTMTILDYGVDYYQAVSRWHVETLLRSDLSLSPDRARPKFFLSPNGVDPARYQNRPERVPFRAIYSSSPDRGLHHLLRIWPEVRRIAPQAELRIFYEMQRWFDITESIGEGATTYRQYREVKEGLKRCEDLGVSVMGGVGQWRLAQEQMMASAMVYPCDTVDKATEGFGISILEAMTAGIPAITTDCDAFGEVWGDSAEIIPLPVEGKEYLWAEKVAKLIDPSTPEWANRVRIQRKKAAALTWDKVGKDYERFISEALAKKREVAREGTPV